MKSAVCLPALCLFITIKIMAEDHGTNAQVGDVIRPAGEPELMSAQVNSPPAQSALESRSMVPQPADKVMQSLPTPGSFSAESSAPIVPPDRDADASLAPLTKPDELKNMLNSVLENNRSTVEKLDALKQSSFEKFIPALFGLLGILAGGLINFFLHRNQLMHGKAERTEKFSFEVRQKIFEYRSKQINEFYGPLLVLLAQSKELSTQLYDQLSVFAPKRYQYRTNILEQPPKKTLYVNNPARPIPFRLIEELPNLGVLAEASLPQVAVIIEVGNLLSELINKTSGLANPKNLKLSSCLGTYLAHLSALKDAYAQAKSPERYHFVRRYTAVFPREIYTLAKADYDAIIEEIAAWENLA